MKFSDNTENIFKALAGFRAEIIQPRKDADNPFFKSKYVPLENVVEVIDKVAPKYKLSFNQNITSNETGAVGVQTLITHESGEYILFDWLYIKPDKVTPQGQGSALTYARRYALSSAFGIASDIDDDGNEANGNRKKKTEKGLTEEQKKNLQEIKDLKEQIKDTDENYDEDMLNEWLLSQTGFDDVETLYLFGGNQVIQKLKRLIKAKNQPTES